MKKWLIDNGYEDWTKGRKYDALYDLNEKKLENSKFKKIDEKGNIYIISPSELYKSAEEKYNKSHLNNRIFTGGYSSV